MQCCSLQHQTLLSPADTTATERRFRFGPALFLELFLHSSPVALGTYQPRGSSSGVISFCLFMGFSRQERWSGLPFPSPADHVLSELSVMTRSSWVSPHCMTHSFIELHKAVIHMIILVSSLWFWFSFWRPWDWNSCFFCLPSDGWE